MSEVVDAFNDFGKYLVKQSRTNLTKGKKNATKSLYDSLNYNITESKNSIEFTFSMEDYGDFIDKGVKGVGGKKADGKSWKKKRVTNSLYRFKTKRPPASVFNGWMTSKGVAPRNKKGQFTTRKGMQFAIANSVFHTGLETTEFYSKPFDAAFKRLPDAIVEAYGLEIDNLLLNT